MPAEHPSGISAPRTAVVQLMNWVCRTPVKVGVVLGADRRSAVPVRVSAPSSL